jgi:hypothetical protein
MIARTGKTDRHVGAGRRGQLGQDCQSRSVRTRMPNRTARTVQLGQDRKDRTARTGPPGQDRQDRTARTAMRRTSRGNRQSGTGRK